MSFEKPRIARLIAILIELQSKTIVTAKSIANKHQISIRTVYRDILTLKESGVPIVSENGKGYSLIEGYNLPPVMFSEPEALALVTAEYIISKNNDRSLVKHFQSASTKVKAILKDSQKHKISFIDKRFEIRVETDKKLLSNYLIELQQSISSCALIHLEYISLNGDKTEREVEPFSILFNQGYWVLVAFCRLRNDYRAFRLDCIQVIKILPEVFTPHQITHAELVQKRIIF